MQWRNEPVRLAQSHNGHHWFKRSLATTLRAHFCPITGSSQFMGRVLRMPDRAKVDATRVAQPHENESTQQGAGRRNVVEEDRMVGLEKQAMGTKSQAPGTEQAPVRGNKIRRKVGENVVPRPSKRAGKVRASGKILVEEVSVLGKWHLLRLEESRRRLVAGRKGPLGGSLGAAPETRAIEGGQ